MQPNDMQAVLEQLVQTVSVLCDHTAGLVDASVKDVERSSVANVRRDAEQLREAGRVLLSMLGTSQRNEG